MINLNCDFNNKNDLKDVASFLKIISEENRLKILCILKKEEVCVCVILKKLNMAQNLVSHHLKILKDFELIKSRKEGQRVYYSINKKEINDYTLLLNKILKQYESKSESH